MKTFTSFKKSLRGSIAVLAMTAGLSVALRADENNTWSDEATEQLPKLDAFQKNNKFGDAIVFLDGYLKKVQKGSYDETMFLQFKAKFLLMDNRINEAAEPFEQSLIAGIAKKQLKADDIAWTRFYLAQIYYQQGSAKGVNVKGQKAAFRKAADMMAQYLQIVPKYNVDAGTFYANVLYNLALINLEVADKVDLQLIEEARKVVEDALTQTAKPKENLLLLMVAILQQQSKWPQAADYLEAIVTLTPNSKMSWQQLFATYYQLSQEAKTQADVFSYSLRAALTMDRAQKLGFMKEPKDNFNRVGIYFNIQQFEKATDLLDGGLRSGEIEDTLKNWELLSFSYSQIKKEEKAIETLREAARRYPDQGSLYFSIAQNFYGLDKPKDAYEAATRAIKIGKLDKPYPVYSFAAYMAFELRQFDDALNVIKKAMEFPEAATDKQIAQLKKAIEDSITEREINRRAIDTQHKNT